MNSFTPEARAVLLSCFLLCSVKGQRSDEENLSEKHRGRNPGGDVVSNRCNPDSAHSEDDGSTREQSTNLLTIILSCQEAGVPAGGLGDYDGLNPKHIQLSP